ncbi:proclotting enzyme [Nephila pilipes]|uniref:Proclotting enzyme n=1 Tax=Nephila pilipes TaxID=299642 RepID=A0A8X6NCT5_NEPPI|nr:proclotting enzyme [Nephila pilipes]
MEKRCEATIAVRECGVTRFPNRRVVGGQPAEKGSWPWMAVVFVEKRNGGKSPDCGGALVTTRHVVTAAHCIVTGRGATTMSPQVLSVRLGAHDLGQNNEPGAVDISVDAVRRHEEFDPRTYKNDIAVLRLSRPIQFHDDISPVCLPFDSLYNTNLTHKTSYVTGFGTTSFNGASSDVLMEASFDIQGQELCRKAYERELNITEEYLCAGMMDGSKDSCQGDSGGPLVTTGKENKYYLVGIVSFGKLCAQPGYPGVYTRVTKYLDWLRTNLAN